MTSKIHDLKIKTEYAELYFQGKKHWEIRFNDRDFKAGDIIRFHISGTKNTYIREICNVFSDFGMQDNYVILSLSVISDDYELLEKYGLDNEIEMNEFLHGFKSAQIQISVKTFVKRFRDFSSKNNLTFRSVITLLNNNPNFTSKQVIYREGFTKIRGFHIQKNNQ